MALTPILKLLSIADDASSIQVKDESLNLTTVYSILFQVANFSNLSYYTTVLASNIIDIFTADGYTFPASDASAVTGGSVFKDGVYDFKYDIVANTFFSFTTSGSQFFYTGADVDFADVTGFLIIAYDTTKIFYIDTTIPLTGTGGSIVGTFPTGSVTACPVYESNLKVLISKSGETCLVQDTAVWSDCGCPADTDFRDIWLRYTYKIAMQNKFAKALYYDAHNLAVKLASYCSAILNSCGCQ